MRLLLLAALIIGCGTEVTQRQEVEATITIHYPDCTDIEDDQLRVDCIVAASTLKIQIAGLESLSEGEIAFLESLGILVDEEEELTFVGEEV